MDDLFADEQSLECSENIILVNNKSFEDPVLLKDQRVLSNILKRQNEFCLRSNYFETVQTEIKPHMRKIVSDWMLEVCEEQQCQPEVFSLAINYMDRFLSKVNIQKNQFQLLGCVCMFIASKFNETAPLPAQNLSIYTDHSVTALEIIQWELLILKVLEWELSAITSYSILDHLLRTLTLAPPFNLDQVRKHAETFVALTATEHTFSQKSPSVVAVACLAEALRGLNAQGLQEMLYKLQGITGVQKDSIKECMDEIAVSIKMSLSGVSFQPNPHRSNNHHHTEKDIPSPVPLPTSAPKIIPQQPGMYHSQSTTPTDLMEVSMVY